MFHRRGRARDSRRGRAAGCAALDNDQPPIDLLSPVHPRRVFLADEAALAEADAVQFGGIAFEPEDVAELGAAFANAKAEAMLEPADLPARRAAPSQRWPSSNRRGSGVPSPSSDQCTASAVVALDPDRPPQAIDSQALDQVFGGRGLAVEQQVLAIRPDDEVEQAFTLRRQKPGPHGQTAVDVAGDEPLQEAAHILARKADRRRGRSGWCQPCALAREPSVASQTLTIRKPDDWHVHLRDGEMLQRVAPLHGAAVCAGDRHAQPGAAGDDASRPLRDYRKRILEATGAGLHATDDLLPDR